MDQSTGSFPAARRASKAYPNLPSRRVAWRLNQARSRSCPQCRAPSHVLQKTPESLCRRRTHPFNYRHVPALQLDQDRHFTTKREMRELNHRCRENSRDTSIDGITTVLKDTHARLD